MARFINPERARAIAYQWHGGMSSPIYAFASSGLVADQLALLAEIRACEKFAENKTALRILRGLYRFAQSCLARVPGRYPFAAPWGLKYIKEI